MSESAAEPSDVLRVAKDAGPFVSAVVAVVVAVGGLLTGSQVSREVQSLREAVIRLEAKVAQAEGSESRIRVLELEGATVKAEVATLKAHMQGGPK